MPTSTLLDRIKSTIGNEPEPIDAASAGQWLSGALKNLSLLIPESEAFRYTRELEVDADGLDLTSYRYFYPHKAGRPAFHTSGTRAASTGSGYYKATENYPVSYIKDSKLYIVPGGGHVEALGLADFTDLDATAPLSLPPQLEPAAFYYVAAHYFADLVTRAADDMALAPQAPTVDPLAAFPALSLDRDAGTLTLKAYPLDNTAPDLTLATDYPTLSLDDLPDQPALIAPDLESMGLESYPASPSLVPMPGDEARPTVALNEVFPTLALPDMPAVPVLTLSQADYNMNLALDAQPPDTDLPDLSLDATYPNLTIAAIPAMPEALTSGQIDFDTASYPDVPVLIPPPDPAQIPPLSLDTVFPSFTPQSIPNIPAMIDAEAVGLSLEQYTESLTIGEMPVAPVLPELTAITDFPVLSLTSWPEAPLAPSISFDPADAARVLSAPTVTSPSQGVGDTYAKVDQGLDDPPDYGDAHDRSADDDIEMLHGELAKLRTKLENYQAEMADEVNRVMSLAREYDAKVQHSLEQGRLTVNVDTQMEQINSQVDMMNKSKGLEKDIAQYRALLERFSTQSQSASAENQILLAEFTEKTRQIIEDKSHEISRYRALVEKYATDVQSVATHNQSLIAAYNAKVQAIVAENNDILSEFRTRLESYNSEVQARVQAGQLNVSEYAAQVQKVVQDNQTRVQAHQAFITKYVSEVNANATNNQTVFGAYRTTVEAIVAQNQLMAEEYRVKLESYNSEVNAKVNEGQLAIGEYNAKVQKVVQDNATRLQEYQSKVQTFVARVEKVNANNQNMIQEYVARVQATAQQNADAIAEYMAYLQKYSIEVQSKSTEGQLLLGEFQTKSGQITAHNQTLVAKYQGDIALFQTDFQKAATQNQVLLQKYATDVQAVAQQNSEILAEYRTRLESYVALVQKQASQGQQDLSAFAALVQKVSVDNQTRIGEFQALLGKFVALVNKASEENQSELARFAALIQQMTVNNAAELQEYQANFETTLRTLITNAEMGFATFDRSLAGVNNDNAVVARKLQAYSERMMFFERKYQTQAQFYMRSVAPEPLPPPQPREEYDE